MEKIGKKVINLSIKNSIFIVIAIIAVIITGTFAWLNWRSTDTALVLTIGDIRKVQVTLKPYIIDTSFAPSITYTGQEYVTVTAVNNGTSSGMVTLYYKINSIDPALKASSDFRYTITKNNGSAYEVIKEGNFTSATAGNDYIIFNDSIAGGNTASTYRVYVWLNSNGDQTALEDSVFNAELRASINDGQYTAVDYLEGKGTQYIDTGVYPDINTKIELEAMALMHDSSSDYAYQITGERASYRHESAIQVAYRPNYQQSDDIVIIDYGTAVGGRLNSSLNTKFKVVVENNNMYIDDTSVTQEGTFSGTSAYTLYIFNYNTPSMGKYDLPFIGRIYSYKIYQNGELIRNFIPVKRNSDNELGLYDVVNGVFYTNQGTGRFITNLPDTYQAVEYLQSTGTQYIDTGVYPNINTKIELEAMALMHDSSSDYAYQITGERASYHHGSAIQVAYRPNYQQSDDIVIIDYGTAVGGRLNSSLNTKFKVVVENNNMYIDDTSVTQEGTFSGTAEYSLWIFDDNSAGTPERGFIGRIYSYKIYDDDILIRYFVPCYRKSDGKPGLYDVVNDVFYTNAGTGEFSAGNIVN